MSLFFSVAGASRLDDRVWKASLSPAEISALGLSAQSAGDTTVLLLSEPPKFDVAKGELTFQPKSLKLLNAGTSNTAIFVGVHGQPGPAKRSGSHAAPSDSGDAAFLSSLPESLAELGGALLASVRAKYPGELRFYEKSGRYVETPDNFWTIKPQSRDVSFRITVRGAPESFSGAGSLQVKADQTGYSSFKLERQGQVEAAIRMLSQVRRK